MVGSYFELGGGKYHEKVFSKTLFDKTEELIAFFGEEYRDVITKKTKDSIFVIVHRYNYNSKAEERLDKWLDDFITSEFGSLDAINNAYYPNGTLTKQQVVEAIKSAASMSKPSDDIVNIIIANMTKGTVLPESTKFVFYNTYVAGNAFKTHIKANFANKLVEYDKLKKQVELQEKYERAYSLDEREDAVRTCMEQVFGDDVKKIKYNSLEDISTIYLNYYKLGNKQETSIEQIEKITSVFNQLTKQNLQLGDYLTDEEFLQKLAQLNALIEEKFKEIEKIEAEKGRSLRAPIRNLADTLEDDNKNDWEYDISKLGEYIIYLYNYGAYCRHKVKIQGSKHYSLVVLPEDLFGLTHEMLHAISTNGKSYYSFNVGFMRNGSFSAFNEAITELFNCIIKKYDLTNYKNAEFNSYSAAFPILQSYVLKHLEDFKKWYITNDIASVKQLMGEDFEPLCKALKELLELAENMGYTAKETKYYLKHPDECKDEQLLNLLNECRDYMQIVNSVDPYGV